MLQYFMKCVYCKSKKLYYFKSGQLKCSSCRKKFSPKKIQRNCDVIKLFCSNFTVNQASKQLKLHYTTVKVRYELIRKSISIYQEQQYQQKNVKQYDEYIYLAKSKNKVKQNIFDAQNFITFNYENKVYNLIMPNLSKYKEKFIVDGANEAYFKEFSKFMMLNKISKVQKSENIIQRFWNFFEESILRYKGINERNFFYYLKECEFKFNYTKIQQEKILLQIVH